MAKLKLIICTSCEEEPLWDEEHIKGERDVFRSIACRCKQIPFLFAGREFIAEKWNKEWNKKSLAEIITDIQKEKIRALHESAFA